MTYETMKACFEEAAELGIRFPDLPDYEVLDFVADVRQLSAIPPEDTALARAILASYKDHTISAGIRCAQTWGIYP